MEPCRSLALLTSSLGLVSLLVALSTNFWFVAQGPKSSSHSGLWPSSDQVSVAGYIHVTQSFCILAVLWGLISTAFLVMSCIPSLSAPGRGPIVSTFMAFAGGEDSVLGLGGGEGCVCWDLVSCCRGAEPTLVSPSPALSLIVAMTVYTIERWNQPGNPQVQSFFSWSFYLGWVSTLLFLCTGGLSLGAHCTAHRPGYESM
ncbi:NKG7 [Cervus elaphus hippelaphus]|uniref:NKG7 n=1 Tax=Cervus elaphus hippelaphus TaxID=46360 RepID=A0A212DDX5_CEREH|nr:NKG7 [Cervus elaphus hippelaphus]